MLIFRPGAFCRPFNSIYKMKKLRMGVMGCANIAQRLMIPAIKEMPDKIELVAIASRDGKKAEKFASLFACEAVAGYDTLLSRDDIDAIYMPLPTGLHKEWINKALEAGKHIYAEKSIAMTKADAREMVGMAKSMHCAIMEGYMYQYHKQHAIVKQMIADGEIGEPRVIRASFGFPPFPDPKNFRYDNVIGGGALKDAAGYVWRCVNFLYGNIFKVTAANVYYDEKGTSIFGSAFLTNGGNVSAEISFGFDNFYQCNYEIWGSKGKISSTRAFTPKPNEETHIIVEKQGERHDIVVPRFNHFVAAMEEFYRICGDASLREKHYRDIVYQAEGLDDIEKLSHN